MKFLEKVEIDPKSNRVIVDYVSGFQSFNGDIAQFFKIMEDKEQDVEGTFSYIKLGRMVDPNHDWDEAERVLHSFESFSAAKKPQA